MDATHPIAGIAYKGINRRDSPSTIYIVSDIHTEMRAKDYRVVESFPDADILILAGDIGNINTEPGHYQRTIRDASEKYKDVVVVTGNHEYYQCQFDRVKVLKKLREICEEFPNVHFLQRETKVIQGIEFIGATLWTIISKESCSQINDIRNQVFRDQIENVCEFADDFRFIKGELEKPSIIPRVVVTHHLPCFRLINRRFLHCGINDAFYTNVIDSVNLRGVALWACGHTHESAVVKYMDAQLVVNPIGYPGETRATQISLDTYAV